MNVEAETCLEALPDLHAKQEPVAVAEEPLSEEPVTRKASEVHLKSEEPPTVDAKVPEDEETKNVDAERALLEDKELIQIVESIISDEREQLACENIPVCEATKDLIDDLEPISKKVTKVADEADSFIAHGMSSVVKLAVDTVLSPVEEPVVGTEEPLLVAEEIADIVEEILRITQEQETVCQMKTEEVLRNNFKESLVVAEEPLTTSVEPALVAEEEMSPAAFEFILDANGALAVDEESWVIIEEPARPLNVSAHSRHSEEPALTKSKCNSAESTQILSQLKSICTKALEDASYKPLSVDVCADESTIHITIEVCLDEFTCLNKVSYDTDVLSTRKALHGQTHHM